MKISSWVLSLHYAATVFILVVASLTVTIKQFGGRPIECAVGRELAGEVVNNYCWVHATFSRWGQPPFFTDSQRTVGESADLRGRDVVFDRAVVHQSYPGVQAFSPNGEVRRHRYYQWVAGVLLVQVRFFFLFIIIYY